jgi:PPOX class probable F420-dependent enzyme
MRCRVPHDRAVIDQSTEFGARVAAHLREDPVVWLTTVSAGGAPLPTPVWFLWDGAEGVRIQSLPSARRIEHITANPHVSLNFAGNGIGGDIVVFSGRATVDDSAPPAQETGAYMAKYAEQMAGMGLSPDQFSARYATVLRVALTRLRGH